MIGNSLHSINGGISSWYAEDAYTTESRVANENNRTKDIG